MTKHTPGPWQFTGAGPVMHGYSQPFAIIEQGQANLIAGVFGDVQGGVSVAKSNAARIVLCVNSHNALLAACKRSLPWIGNMIADSAHLNSVAPNDCVGAMQQLKAAIDAAESEGA